MPGPSDALDTLLRLGEEIEAAVDADDWTLVSELVEQRADAARQVRSQGEQTTDEDLSPADRDKLEALTDQHQSLMEQLQAHQDELEEELAQIGDLKHAHDSYESTSTRGGVLPPELRG